MSCRENVVKPFSNKSIAAFEKAFNPEFEERALTARAEFMRAFPVARLSSMRLSEYSIGRGRDTFCSWVEPRTKEWAFITGATAHKFGIYFGVEKHDQETPRYRVTAKVADSETNPSKAFRVLRRKLLKLLDDGKQLRFDAIDESDLSQMFRAKILSLYYPHLYLNVCSDDTIQLFGDELGIEDTPTYSEMQHELLRFKKNKAVTRNWSNPKFMAYLHYLFLPAKGIGLFPPGERKSREERKVDWELLNARRAAIGKTSEAFALQFEEDRLVRAGLAEKVPDIEDRTDRPGYGHDFLSFSSARRRRMIEVKTATRLNGSQCCFFLSRNEEKVSRRSTTADYYFYIVYYDENRVPQEVVPVPAETVYEVCDQQPDGYRMIFDADTWGE